VHLVCRFQADAQILFRTYVLASPLDVDVHKKRATVGPFVTEVFGWFAVLKRHSRIRSIIGPESNAVLVGIRGKCVCEGLRVNQQRLSL